MMFVFFIVVGIYAPTLPGASHNTNAVEITCPTLRTSFMLQLKELLSLAARISQTKMKLLKRKMDTGAHIVGFAMSSPDNLWTFPPLLSENIETVDVTTGLSFDWSPWNWSVPSAHGFGMKSSKTLNAGRPRILSLATCSSDGRRSNCSEKALPRRNFSNQLCRTTAPRVLQGENASRTGGKSLSPATLDGGDSL